MQSRRTFLKYFLLGAGCFTAKAFAIPILNLNNASKINPNNFPQGVASADPQEDAIMLWVRVEPNRSNTENVNLLVQVCEDNNFGKIVLQSEVTASMESDHTIRFFAEGLQADHIYYYRFITEDMTSSPIGRTRTAPKKDADRQVSFAWASCQNYEQGFYGAWAKMLHDDKKAVNDDKLDFILHVGDFIYESINSGFRDESTKALYGNSSYLMDSHGNERKLPPLPSGGSKGKYGGYAAVNLQDYRHIYKEYLKDPNLQAARARWPFVCVWDDHEFGDNCWQSHLGNVANQKGRLAANQAWFEYVPTVLSQAGAVDGVNSEAYDFKRTSVKNVPFGDPGEALADKESNNLSAIHSMHIYRTLRYGRHLKLALTDSRSFRSDHAIPEWWKKKYFSEKSLQKTASLIAKLDRAPEESSTVISNNGVVAPNPRKITLPGSILGEAQKEWWKKSIINTDATWKIWANSVPLMSLTYEKDNTSLKTLHSDDMWDGYPTERQELLQFIENNKIKNIVSLSADLHAHIAGVAGEISNRKKTKSIVPEFVTAGIASASMYRIRRLITPKDSPFYKIAVGSGNTNFALLNNTILNGATSSLAYDKENKKINKDKTNGHLKYIDTDATGYGLVKVRGNSMEVTLITMANPLIDFGEEPDVAKGVVTFRLKKGKSKPKVLSMVGNKPYL